MTALSSPATARNKDLILEVLRAHLPASGLVLEVASGAGEHAVHMAASLPGLTWQPSDPDSQALASIAAWRAQAGTVNLLAPLELDAARPDNWPVRSADAIVCINMIHISPWAATEGLFTGAGRLLPDEGVLVTYGPYLEDEVETAPSNLAFDTSLKSRNPAWGLRRRENVEALAARHGLALHARVAMPANNLSLVFRRSANMNGR
ncbi:DUF938 domain-containing protein [Caulobacter sp. NIBR1757]|uniref:DUF938 domain-containing protein n=1 Tax=Caulobacter sp. NIBR1757 TaxID=3016000 RepID=UPI0022F034CA|nr:DUF938 domain-containing protein [Caulobacter sp. NIBR1757]WGM41009.1 hypothetical protein AMEJIAPC_03957 [Caulobacter sp. NIBR1757]